MGAVEGELLWVEGLLGVEYAIEIGYHRNEHEAMPIFGANLHKRFKFDAGAYFS